MVLHNCRELFKQLPYNPICSLPTRFKVRVVQQQHVQPLPTSHPLKPIENKPGINSFASRKMHFASGLASWLREEAC